MNRAHWIDQMNFTSENHSLEKVQLFSLDSNTKVTLFYFSWNYLILANIFRYKYPPKLIDQHQSTIDISYNRNCKTIKINMKFALAFVALFALIVSWNLKWTTKLKDGKIKTFPLYCRPSQLLSLNQLLSQSQNQNQSHSPSLIQVSTAKTFPFYFE